MGPNDSLADRAWHALHCLDRVDGEPPALKDLEERAKLANGTLGKAIRGILRYPRGKTESRLASALGVSTNWLIRGEGRAPSLTGPIGPRPVGGESRRGRRSSVPPNSSVTRVPHLMPSASSCPALNVAISYHESRWSRATVAAAKELTAGHLDKAPSWWGDYLDRLDRAIQSVALPSVGEPIRRRDSRPG